MGTEVNLVGALLSKVQLSAHCLKGIAQLDNLDLSQSILWEANLGDVSLKEAGHKGELLGVRHLSCSQLMKAKNWERAKTDLKCEKIDSD